MTRSWFRPTLLGLSTTVLLACGVDPAGSSTSESLETLSCPAGEVAWDFRRFPNGTTSESLAQLGGATVDYLDGGAPDDNVIKVSRSSCSGLNGTIDLTNEIRRRCNGRTSCLVANAYSILYIERFGCLNANQASMEFTCSDEPDMVKTASIFNASCLPRRQPRDLRCVPDNCYGRTRRDRYLRCVPDLIKPVESLEGLTVHFDHIERPLRDPTRTSDDGYEVRADGRTVIALDNNLVYRFSGTVEVPGTQAPRQLITLWLKSRMPEVSADSPRGDMFRCVIGRIDLSKYTATATATGQRVPFDELLRIPDTCQDGAPFQQALRTALVANDFDPGALSLPTSAAQSELMVSYDLESRSIAVPPGSTVDTTCNVKPLDFFFNPRTRVHNTLDYYGQQAMRVVHRSRANAEHLPLVFNPAPKNLVAVTEVNVRGLEFKVNKAGRPRGQIPVDLSMALSGPNAEQWAQFFVTGRFTPYGALGGPNQKYLSLDANTPGDANFTTALLPVPDTAARDALGRVAVDASAAIPLPARGLRAAFTTGLSEGGASARLDLPITQQLRTALFNPAGRYPLTPGGTRNYVLQLCPTGRVYAELLEGSSAGRPFEVSPSGVVRDGDEPPLVSARNGCARSAVFSFYGQNIVVPLAEVDVGDGNLDDLNPTSSGESRLSAKFDVDTSRQCQGARCETTSQQGLAGSDNPARSTILLVATEEAQDDTSERFATSFRMLGFDMLEAVQSGNLNVKTTLAIAPNYAAIAEALDRSFPAFEIEADRVTVGVNGLSVGLEFKVPLRFGPIQGDLVFGVGVGAGIGLELTHEYNNNVASSCVSASGDGTLQSNCPGTYVALPAMTLPDAREACTFIGGVLVEPRDDATATSMRTAIPSTEEVWIAAQVGNEYRENTSCATSWSSSLCANGHKTYLRWLSDGDNFRTATSFGAFSSVGAPSTLGGTAVTVASLSSTAPVPSGVTLLGNELRSRPLANRYRSVCARPRVTSGVSHMASIAIGVGFSAGFSVGFCTPSADFGICLEGSVNLLDAKLEPKLEYTHTKLSDNAGLEAINSKMALKVDWSINLLSGGLEIKLVTPFFDVGYTLIEWEGFKQGEGTLAEWEQAFREDFQ